jgi:hypothetical protein
MAAVSRQFQRTSRVRRWRPDWLADVAVSCEPVSASEFPANREINREFCRIRPSIAIFASDQRADSMSLTAEFPMKRNREFSNAYQEIFFEEQGNLIKQQ